MSTRKKPQVFQVPARLKKPLRDRLAKAAKERGVSMNAEIVDRLEGSFLRVENFGGHERYVIMRMIATAWQVAEVQTGKSWKEDYQTAQAVKGIVDGFLEQFGGKPGENILLEADTGFKTGQFIVEKMIESLRQALKERKAEQ